MLYEVKLFDGTDFDITEEEAEKAYPRFLEGKNVILRGSFLNAKAIASIKPYTIEHFGRTTAHWKWLEEKEMLEAQHKKNLETNKNAVLPVPRTYIDAL